MKKGKKKESSSSLNLQDLTNLAIEVDQMLQDSEGEITPEIESKMSTLTEDFPNKVQAYAHIIKRKESDLAMYEQLIKDTQTRIRSKKAEILRIHQRLEYAMKAARMDKVDGVHAVNLYDKAPAVNITDASLVPTSNKKTTVKFQIPSLEFNRLKEYISEIEITTGELVTETTVIDKKKVLQRLKDGDVIPGAQLITGQKRLSIK